MELPKDYNLLVGLRIRELRENLSYTREQFAALCDISESFLTAIERGQKSLSSKTLYKICKGANVSADYIVQGKGHGYEMDVLLELFQGLDERYVESATRILSEYVKAIKLQ